MRRLNALKMVATTLFPYLPSLPLANPESETGCQMMGCEAHLGRGRGEIRNSAVFRVIQRRGDAVD